MAVVQIAAAVVSMAFGIAKGNRAKSDAFVAGKEAFIEAFGERYYHFAADQINGQSKFPCYSKPPDNLVVNFSSPTGMAQQALMHKDFMRRFAEGNEKIHKALQWDINYWLEKYIVGIPQMQLYVTHTVGLDVPILMGMVEKEEEIAGTPVADSGSGEGQQKGQNGFGSFPLYIAAVALLYLKMK